MSDTTYMYHLLVGLRGGLGNMENSNPPIQQHNTLNVEIVMWNRVMLRKKQIHQLFWTIAQVDAYSICVPERPIAKYTKGFNVWPVRCGLSVGFAPVSS